MSYKFKAGDKVSFGGIEGVVESNFCSKSYPIYACGYTFTKDGRLYAEHTTPLLILLEPAPKVKVKKTREVWINIYPDGASVHASRIRAERNVGVDHIACVGPVVLEWFEEGEEG